MKVKNGPEQGKESVMSEPLKCGCGRSPTGNCVGWHSLSEQDYNNKKAAYETAQSKKVKK